MWRAVRLPFVAGPCLLTGSRAFGVSDQHSDYDYVSFFSPCSSWWEAAYCIGDGYQVFRRANVNLISVCSSLSWFRWMEAHDHCCVERPASKTRRKVIFDHYMYGTPLHCAEPIPRCDRWWFTRSLDARNDRYAPDARYVFFRGGIRMKGLSCLTTS